MKNVYFFVDVEGTKSMRQMIIYLAVTGHFIQQKRCQSAAAQETDVQLYGWSTDVNIVR